VNLASLTFETRRSTDGQDQYLQSVVSAVKDVEGLNHQFLFNLYHK
jgi:5,10-methylene-tetrahydrofolate dehydrogenase/methenyl tetrahydrofolate cyclohydrolase